MVTMMITSLKSFARLAAVCVSVAVQTAQAAPFCVDVIGIPPSCLYYDSADCDKRASQLGGRCIANAAEFQRLAGPGRFCLVESSKAALCVYADDASCEADAHQAHAACLDSAATNKVHDVFQGEPGRRY